MIYNKVKGHFTKVYDTYIARETKKRLHRQLQDEPWPEPESIEKLDDEAWRDPFFDFEDDRAFPDQASTETTRYLVERCLKDIDKIIVVEY